MIAFFGFCPSVSFGHQLEMRHTSIYFLYPYVQCLCLFEEPNCFSNRENLSGKQTEHYMLQQVDLGSTRTWGSV